MKTSNGLKSAMLKKYSNFLKPIENYPAAAHPQTQISKFHRWIKRLWRQYRVHRWKVNKSCPNLNKNFKNKEKSKLLLMS